MAEQRQAIDSAQALSHYVGANSIHLVLLVTHVNPFLAFFFSARVLQSFDTEECKCYSATVKITLASMKGGVAKTTTAVHVAAYLAELGPTVLIDADPNNSACSWAKRGNLRFPVLPLLKAIGIGSQYEHIIVDTQARPKPEELRDLVEGCDLLIVPTTPDPLSLEGMMLTLSTLKRFGAENYRVLLTIVPPEPIPEGKIARQELEAVGIPLFKHTIRRLMAFQRAAADGVVVNEVRDRNARLAAMDYEYIAEESLAIVESRSRSVTAS